MTTIRVGIKRVGAAFLLTVLFSLVFLINSAETEAIRPRVVIQVDGTVSPETAPIERNGNTYTLTGNIYAEISVQKSNVIIDGAGYTLQGTYNGTYESAWVIGEGPNQVSNDTKVPYSIGVDIAFPSVTGLTVKNLNIKNFSIGVYVWTENNTVAGNAVTDTIVGVLLSGSNNSIIRNYVARNTQGVFFGWNEPGEVPATIDIDHNCFDSNAHHLSGCLCEDYNLTETPHTWDDGREGNYWSDYNGADADGDGIGDTPYVIDVLNRDRYPLMENPVALPTPAQNVLIWVLFVVTFVVVVVAVLVIKMKKVYIIT